jgi:catechol 2,3-dioxygenase-like lactoylglutathione lyase family enzyme
MFKEFNHVGIVVKDIRTTLKFYQENFGAVFVRGLYIPASHTVGAYVQIGANMLEFLCPLSPEGNTQYGITHLGFIVDDIEAESYNLIGKGYKFDVLPKKAGSGAGKVAFLTDPNGGRIELIERVEALTLPEWTPTEDVIGFDHASVYADNLETAIEFYTKDLYFNVVHNIHVGGNRNFSMVYMNFGKKILELLHNENKPHTGPLMGHIALLVKDTKKLYEKLTAKGIQANSEPRLLATGNGNVCNLKDPDGNGVEIIDRVSLFEMKKIIGEI